MVASFSEESRFKVNGQTLQPLDYRYHKEVLGKKRDARLHFDWEQGKVTNQVQNKPWDMSVDHGTLDKLNYQLQLRRDLSEGRTKLRYPVADGGIMKTYDFSILGEEKVQTPMGEYTAVKVRRERGPDSKRETLIWFAKELDYLIVKLKQVEKNGKSYMLLLHELQR
jgi:hypothetical protein